MLTILCCGLLVMTGCQTRDHQHQTILRFSTWGSAEEMAVLTPLIKDFEKANPGVHVDVMHIPENYFQKLHILIAGDLAPDVIFINSLNLPVYAENGILKPLDNLIAHDQKVFFPSALKALTWQNHLYAIPRDVSDLVVFYNQDMFQKYGLKTPSPDWTLADLVSLAKTLTQDTDHDGSIDQFGVSFFGKPPLMWLPFVWSQGGTLFDSHFDHFTLTSTKAIAAAQFYSDLRNRRHIAPRKEDAGSATMSQLLIQGKLAMLISGRWSVPILRKTATFHWDVLPFPRGEAGSVVGVDASGYAIAQSSQHPKEAMALIRYLSSESSQHQFAQSGLIVPAREDVANSQDFLNQSPQHSIYFIQAALHGLPTHTPARWNEIEEELNLALEPVWEGTQSAQSAIDTVNPKIEALLK